MLVPLYDRVIVRPIPEGETACGIIMPEVAKQNLPYMYGTVIAVGSGRVFPDGQVHALTLKVGDTVIFGRRVGLHMPYGERDEEHVLLNEMEIIAYERPNVVYPKPVAGPVPAIDDAAQPRCPRCLRHISLDGCTDGRLPFHTRHPVPPGTANHHDLCSASDHPTAGVDAGGYHNLGVDV